MFSAGKKKSGSAAGRHSAGLSFIAKDVVVSGDFVTGAQVHIDGRIDGNVRCETLVQGEDGTIAGNIVAESVHLSGLVDGKVTARIVTLEPSARVTGDVSYETLSIAAGGAIEGRLTRKDAGGPPKRASAPKAVESVAEKKRKAPRPDAPALLPNLDAPVAAPLAANG